MSVAADQPERADPDDRDALNAVFLHTITEGIPWPFHADAVRHLMKRTAGRVRWDERACHSAALGLNEGVHSSWESSCVLADDLARRETARRDMKTLRRAVGSKAIVSAVAETNRRDGGDKATRAEMFAALCDRKGGARFLAGWRGAVRLEQSRVQGREPDRAGLGFVLSAAGAWWELTGRWPSRGTRDAGHAAAPFERFCLAGRDHVLALLDAALAVGGLRQSGAYGEWRADLAKLRPLGVSHLIAAPRQRGA